MAYETILFEVEEQIATITLNRPEVMNAWNAQMAAELSDAGHGGLPGVGQADLGESDLADAALAGVDQLGRVERPADAEARRGSRHRHGQLVAHRGHVRLDRCVRLGRLQRDVLLRRRYDHGLVGRAGAAQADVQADPPRVGRAGPRVAEGGVQIEVEPVAGAGRRVACGAGLCDWHVRCLDLRSTDAGGGAVGRVRRSRPLRRPALPSIRRRPPAPE